MFQLDLTQITPITSDGEIFLYVKRLTSQGLSVNSLKILNFVIFSEATAMVARIPATGMYSKSFNYKIRIKTVCTARTEVERH